MFRSYGAGTGAVATEGDHFATFSWYVFLGLSFCVGASAPAGFLTTFSLLAAISGLISLLINKNKRESLLTITYNERLVLIIFGYLALSVLWSSSIKDGLYDLFEYRVFVLVVIYSLVFTRDQRNWRVPLTIFLLGACVSLLVSFGLFFDLFDIDGRPDARSKGDRIFHGIIMVSAIGIILSSFSGFQLIGKVDKFHALKVILIAMFAVNVLAIEIGRTAYVNLAVSVAIFVFVSCRRFFPWLLLVSPLVVIMAYLVVPNFSARIDETYSQTLEYFAHASVEDSPGIRINLYVWATGELFSNPFGHGIGDVADVMDSAFESGALLINADNVHNEYLNFGLIGGVPLTVLLAASFIFWCRESCREKKIIGGEVFAILFSVFATHMLFNSAIKDLGEKSLLTITLTSFLMLQRRVTTDSGYLRK